MKILMAHDGSEHSDKALDRAVEIAKLTGAGLSVVLVATGFVTPSEELSPEVQKSVEDMIMKQAGTTLKKAVERAAAKGVAAKALLERGRPQDKILAAANATGADMIVIGSRGRHGVAKFFLGSVSSKVAEQAACDVLIVK